MISGRTITGLIVDLSSNGLFHRELAVGAKVDAHGGCHLGRRGGSGWQRRRQRRLRGSFPLPLAWPEDVAVVGLLSGPIGIEASGVIPKVPKAGSGLPLV